MEADFIIDIDTINIKIEGVAHDGKTRNVIRDHVLQIVALMEA